MGSEKLLESFVALRSRIARLVGAIVPPKEVEDIVQETYVRVCQFESKGEIREPRSFLFRTAQNLALDYVKKAETKFTSGVDDIDDVVAIAGEIHDQTYSRVTSNEEFALFCDAVRHLPKQCRRAFVLKKVYGYTLREISSEMGIGLPTVESHIVAGTKKCVRYLRDLETNRSMGDRTSQSRRAESRRGGGA